jgi:NitT/TauT family transport system permease protein
MRRIPADKIYLDVGKNFEASRWNVLWTIALPVIMTGVRLGIGMGLVLIAVAEMIGAKSGLGFMIWNAWETFSVERMYVGLLVIAIVGVAVTFLLQELERILIPWKSA